MTGFGEMYDSLKHYNNKCNQIMFIYYLDLFCDIFVNSHCHYTDLIYDLAKATLPNYYPITVHDNMK